MMSGLPDTDKTMNVYLETLGCQMNRLDSELITGQLLAAGYEIVDDLEAADVFLINTCSVRAQAENKVYSRLGREAASKRRRIVGVLGCLAQRRGAGLLKRYPFVNIICGPGQLHALGEMIRQAADGRPTVACDPDRKDGRAAFEGNSSIDSLDHDRNASVGSPAQAYVRVMRGCDKFCTYCIVPFVRGPEISRSPDAIYQEVRQLAEAGRSEITLLGQTVNSYRYSAGETSVRFSDLLERLADVAGVRRLRFVTSYPTDFGDDILQAMRDLPNICRYIHCPPQSGSDRILKAMNRKYTREQYDSFIDRAYDILPDVTIAGDFIVGFPGEREVDHQASADLIRRSRFKNSFIFKYSARPGTVGAGTLEDDVPLEVKRRRNRELLSVQAEVSLEHFQSFTGRQVELLVEGPSPLADKAINVSDDPNCVQMLGRTSGDHITVFQGPESLAGQYVTARVTGATAFTLFAELCGDGGKRSSRPRG
ncbi:MAG: tRNA (N6-isopentenyl adenosine(37)-C2)-methylthiotransferase MiaB [Phycisphaerae bacterium]|jgi:tRNA-2-methylthio-N6-dimethylallyladenosine synthase|nr:tRNA (N6-isopentenyl adenosine(37)-C2)-methylthiotransferase MiaB [Phycisphaerae bacterium]